MTKFHPKPFGKYFLIEKLATGGMAEIYKAKTFGVDGFEKLLAIKRILPHCSADKEFITMLIDEAKLSVLLSHTNIVQVYDLGKVGDDYFISMEYINGCNLREVLNRLRETRGKVDEELVLYIISEVCKGLDYAHSKKDSDGQALGIVHRDISPQNILLSFEGEVKIVDFGIAKAAMNISHTMAGILKGKISYMSPEQALGKPIDRKTDIYSTGLMLYELLTGEKFFKGETQFEVLKKIRTTRITEKSFPETLSEPVRKILAKALAYSLKERYDNAGDFQIDLTRYLYTTYVDFTPRKLAKTIRELFADEIELKNARERQAPSLDAQTRSILIEQQNQENIVHRENTTEQPLDASGNPTTNTFIPAYPAGGEITQTQQGFGKASGGHGAARPKRKLLAYIYPTLIFFLIGGGFWAYFKTDWLKQSQPTGFIELRSNPPGAQVFINDSDTDLLTPATIKNLPIGQTHRITLKKGRYKDWTKSLTLFDSNPVSLQPTLEVIPVGSVKVNSTPPGAKIYLDGKDTGKVTPANLEELPLSGTYTIKLELEKYRAVGGSEDKVTIYSIEPLEFNKKFEEIQYGSVRVSSNPPGARIYLDSNSTGLNTPAEIKSLETGKRYTIRLSRQGYRDTIRSVELQKSETLSLNEKLAKEETPTNNEKPNEKPSEPTKPATTEPTKPPTTAEPTKPSEPTPPTREPPPPSTEVGTAYVAVSSNPKGASVYINGVSQGSTPGKFQVKSGTPTEITINKSGLSTITRVVTLRPGETRNLGTLNLEGSEAAGIIVIDSNPPGAMVSLNGKPQKATPLRIKGLRPGVSYTFTVTKDGYSPWTQSITIGESAQSLMANLKKL